MPLSANQLEQFRLQLLERKRELIELQSIGEQSAETVELDQSRVGRLSRMDAMQSQAMSQETNRRREIEILKIDNALQRIEANEFGYCLTCEEEVALNRLQLDPSVTLCINCASNDS